MRNIIYEVAFQPRYANPPRALEVLEIKQYAPSSALARVNRQLRSETLALYRLAAEQFCKQDHDFYIRMGIETTDAAWRGYVIEYSQDIPRSLPIRTIEIRIEGIRMEGLGDDASHTLVLETRLDGTGWVGWRVCFDWIDSGLNGTYYDVQAPFQDIFESKAELYGVDLKNGLDGLHVPNVVGMGCLFFLCLKDGKLSGLRM